MKTYVINKDTFKNKLAYGALYFGTALVLLRGCDYLVDRKAERQFNTNADEVTELIDNKQFDDARKLIQDFGDSRLVRESDYISLNNKIDREQRKYDELEGTFKNFNDGIDKRNLNQAWTAFKSLDEMEIFDNREQDSLKILLYQISDTYLLNKYAKGDPKEKLEIGQEYLQFYPDGKEAFSIANYTIGKRADVLINNLVFGEKPSRVLEDYTKLNDVLKIKVEGVNVKKFISIKGLDSLTNKYIFDKTYEKSANELVVGDWAVLVSNDKEWSAQEYLTDRRKNIDLGLRGKVIDITKVYEDAIMRQYPEKFSHESKHDKIFLEFPKIEKIAWDNKWEIIEPYMRAYFGNNFVTHGTAAFLDTEVKGIPHMSASQTELLKKNLVTAKDLIENYDKIEIATDSSNSLSSDSLMTATTLGSALPDDIIGQNDSTTIKKDSVEVKKEIPQTKITKKKKK
jgi:hypothetical protein